MRETREMISKGASESGGDEVAPNRNDNVPLPAEKWRGERSAEISQRTPNRLHGFSRPCIVTYVSNVKGRAKKVVTGSVIFRDFESCKPSTPLMPDPVEMGNE